MAKGRSINGSGTNFNWPLCMTMRTDSPFQVMRFERTSDTDSSIEDFVAPVISAAPTADHVGTLSMAHRYDGLIAYSHYHADQDGPAEEGSLVLSDFLLPLFLDAYWPCRDKSTGVEALSVMGKIPEGVTLVVKLESAIWVSSCPSGIRSAKTGRCCCHPCPA